MYIHNKYIEKITNFLQTSKKILEKIKLQNPMKNIMEMSRKIKIQLVTIFFEKKVQQSNSIST